MRANRFLKSITTNANLRYAASQYIPRHIVNLSNRKFKYHNDHDKNENLLLLKRSFGDADEGPCYFSVLSTEEGQFFSPKHNIYPPLPNFPPLYPYRIDIVGSSNGLLCLEDYGLQRNVVLWNPSTDVYKFLPQSSMQRPVGSDTLFYVAGFGFDQKSQDFKVIRFIENYFEDDDGCLYRVYPQVELYSLEKNCWKEILDPRMRPWPSPCAYVDGVYFWIAHAHDNSQVILSFNFCTENFSAIPLPGTGKRHMGQYYNLYLMEFDGNLSALVYPYLGTEKSFDFWVFTDDSWTLVSDFVVHGVERPLGFWKKDTLFLEGVNRELLIFDLSSRELKNVGINDSPETMQLIPCASTPLTRKPELIEF